MPSTDNNTSGSKKISTILTVVIMVCVIIAGGAYAYWHKHYDLSNKSPRELIDIATQKYTPLTTVTISMVTMLLICKYENQKNH